VIWNGRKMDKEPEFAPKQASDEYWQAYEQWKNLDIKLDASKRATREEAHERRGAGNLCNESSACSSNHQAPEIDRTMKPDDLEDMGPRQRLPELRDKICAPGARLRVTLSERDGWRTVGITGNRLGLQALAAICSGLAELTTEELLTPANHYHLDEEFWGAEKGSVPMIVRCTEEGWPELSS
jgi:hypothetical protein